MVFLKPPKFWFSRSGIFLKTFNRILWHFYKHHNKIPYKHKANLPIVAIGGVSVGGAGKTPTAIKIAEILLKTNHKPLVGLRGYGRNCSNVIIVNSITHSFKDVGDEALIISKYAKVGVTKDRSKLESLANSEGCDLIILDDGWSQHDLFVDKKILVIDGHQNLGNKLLFPIGPLRMKPKEAVDQADIIVFLNDDRFKILQEFSEQNLKKIVYMQTVSDFSGIAKDIVIFAGLGCNQKFFDSFQDFNIIKTFAFADHYPYSNNDILNIINFANSVSNKTGKKIDIVTTEKDYQRINSIFRDKIKYVKINLLFKENSQKYKMETFLNSLEFPQKQ